MHGVQWSQVNATTRSSGMLSLMYPAMASRRLMTSHLALASPSCPAMSGALQFISTKSYSPRASMAHWALIMKSESMVPSQLSGRG